VNEVHRRRLSVGSLVVIEVMMACEKALHEVNIIAVMSDILDQLRDCVGFFFLEKYTNDCVVRSIVVRGLNCTWGSFMNNLHLHVCSVTFKLMFTWSIKMNFFSNILEKTFGPWYMYI
jgi:hypothetical protein